MRKKMGKNPKYAHNGGKNLKIIQENVKYHEFPVCTYKF